ncbi:TetR family transcriptional regulator [Microlunatus flavus]|uniref:TetR family transcriptional regulator n=1 Tax=Microlunatus flavus TaxID=1036181 RepID=UPI000B80B81A|nr:TetR family transcriptional regulator [Microlunatus flavus]
MGISVADVVAQALEVVAERGVAGLTMAAVAERLGVRTPTLYHHVRDKAALLRLLARDAFTSFAADQAAYEDVTSVEAWIELTRSGSLRLRDFYAAHPGLAGLVQATAGQDRYQDDLSRGRLARSQIEALARLGVSAGEAKEVFEACARWTLAAVAARTAPGDPAPDEERLFLRGLDWLLSGLRADLARVVGRSADGSSRAQPNTEG